MSNWLYLSPLLIYFPRLVPGVETQPLVPLIVALVALATGPQRRPKLLGVLLLLLVGLLVSLRVLALESIEGIAGIANLLIGPVFLLAVMASGRPPPDRHAIAVVASLFAAFAALEIFAGPVYAAFAGALLDRFSVADGHRGLSFMTPEPSYASISLAYVLVLGLWSRAYHGTRHAWTEWVVGSLLIATLSTYGWLLLMAIAAGRWPRTAALALGGVVLIVSGATTTGLDNDESVRAVVALSRLLAADWSTLLTSLSLVDSSLGSRIITNVAGWASVGIAPFGFGTGCQAIGRALEQLGWDFAYSNAVIVQVLETGCLKPQSYLPNLLLTFGALAVPLLVATVGGVAWALSRPVHHRTWWPPLAVATVLLVVQGQITNPIPWMLLYFGLVGVPDRRPYPGASRMSVPRSLVHAS